MQLFQNLFGRVGSMLSTLTPSTHFLITFLIAFILHFAFPIYLSTFISVNLLQAIGIILLLIALTFNTLAFRAFNPTSTPKPPKTLKIDNF